MAHDDRSGRGRGREGARPPEWRGDEGFGGGRGDRTPRPQRLGDRDRRPGDDPDYGAERYGPGPAEGFGSESFPTGDPGSFFLAPGYDASFAGPRFDRIDVGSVGSHGVHPVASPFGGGRGPLGIAPGGGWGSSARLHAELERAQGGQRSPDAPRSADDPHYAEWHRRRVEQLDRDYDDYRRERQSRFDREFGEWRERRGRQRQAVGRVAGQMEVVGSDGGHVGIVDRAGGDSIVLAGRDAGAGRHHAVPCAWVDGVDDKVRLNLTAEEAKRRWRDEEESGALFDRAGRGGDEG